MASSQGKVELKFADWMASLPESIHSVPLANLAIPGKNRSRWGEDREGALIFLLLLDVLLGFIGGKLRDG